MARSFQQGDEPVVGYKLTRFLGRGGFGEVWQATAPGGTEVAFKIIDLGEKSGLKEFRAIQRVKRVRHPNLVPIIALWLRDENGKLVEEVTSEQQLSDSSYKPAELFIAMGLGDKSLHDRYKECKDQGLQGIPGLELISYIEDAARAIDHLNSPKHDLGSGPVAIQHCDIKPQNILIVGDAAQVCDFGLARVLGENRSTTNPAVTLAFAAPEILEDSNASPSTDQYALAMTYYYLRTGTLPFTKVDPSTIIMEALDGRLDFSRVGAAEQAVIKRATGRKPSARYATCMDMARELRRALENSGGAAKAATLVIEPGSEIVAGHKLVRCLGRGAYGEVWEAMAPGRIPVALKIIRDLDRAGGRGKQEFKALEVIQRVTHNHLMELRAYWLLDRQGQPIPDEVRGTSVAPVPVTLIIATKLADKNLGQVLEEYQARGMPGIPLGELLRYMRQAAEAIDYLNAPRHKLGDRRVSIQHRDIKPDNIMLADGIVRLTDFGLAKVVELDEVSAEIHQDSVGFTFHYAAPEVMRGRVTKWSDQYSLAITYYFLRTGQLPFERVGSAYDMMMRQLEGKLDLTLLPEPERRILYKAVQVVPEERYPTCMSFITGIEQTLPASGEVPPLPHKPSPRSQSAWEMAMLHTPSGGSLPSTHRQPPGSGGMPPELEPMKAFGSGVSSPSGGMPSSPMPLSPSAAMAASAAGSASGVAMFGSLAPLPDVLARSDLGLRDEPDDLQMLDDPAAPHAMPTQRPYTDRAASPEPPPLPPPDPSMFSSIGGGAPSYAPTQGPGAHLRPSYDTDGNRRPNTMHADNLLDLYPELQPIFNQPGGGGPPPLMAAGGPNLEIEPELERDPSYGTIAAKEEGLEEQRPGSRPDWKGREDVSAREERRPNYLLFAVAILGGLVMVLVVGMLWNRGGNRGAKETAIASNTEPKPTVNDNPGSPPIVPATTPSKPTTTYVPSVPRPTEPGPENDIIRERLDRLARIKESLKRESSVKEEETFHRNAAPLLGEDDQYLDAELLAYKAEHLLDGENRVQEAQSCLDKSLQKETGSVPGNYYYVDARLKLRKNPGQPEQAAAALARVENKYLVGFRAKKAMDVYVKAARDWSTKFTADASVLGQDAKGGPAWMPQAEALRAGPSSQVPVDLALLFAWTSPTPKPEHLSLLLDQPPAELTQRGDSAIILAELHRRRAELNKASEPVAAVRDYYQSYQNVKSLKDPKLPATAKCKAVLEPALDWVGTVKNQLDPTARGLVADLFATKGEMIYQEPFPADGNWPNGDDPYREAAKAYEKALEYLPAKNDMVRRRANYHTQKGQCLAKLGQAQLTILEIQDILQDATEATKLNPESPDAHGLQGTALYLQALIDQAARHTRQLEDRYQRVEKGLEGSEAAFSKAINLAGQRNADQLSRWYAARCATLSFWAGVLREEGRVFEKERQKKYQDARTKYEAALKDGRQAVDYNKENETAFAALGIAHMLYAFSLEPGGPDFEDHLEKAEAALKEQVRLRSTQDVGLVTLGLFYAQRGYFAKARNNLEMMHQYHAKARDALQQVIKRNANHPDANYWLGFMAAQEGQHNEAAQFLIKSLQDQKFLRYNLENRIAGSFPEQDLEKILFSPAVDDAKLRPADKAAWLVLRALHRLLQQDKKLQAKLAKGEKPDTGLFDPLKDAMGYLTEVDNLKLVSATIPSLARDIGVSARLLAARLPDVAKEDKVRFLQETETLLQGAGRKLTPASDQQWEILAFAALDLSRANVSRDEYRKLLDLAESASKEADKLTLDDKVKKRMNTLRGDIREARNNPPQ